MDPKAVVALYLLVPVTVRSLSCKWTEFQGDRRSLHVELRLSPRPVRQIATFALYCAPWQNHYAGYVNGIWAAGVRKLIGSCSGSSVIDDAATTQ